MVSSPFRRVACSLLLSATGVAGLAALPAGAQPSLPRPSVEARRAGVQPGNAEMGWRQHTAGEGAGGGARAQADAGTQAYKPSGVLGIDVSSHQGKVNWTKQAKGRQFVFIKATEGTSYKNPFFYGQYVGSRKAGLMSGSYHFASPSGKNGKTQAQYFVRYGGAWKRDGKTLPGVLDIEYNPYGPTCYGVSKTKMVSWINDFVVEYKRLTSRDAIIYTTTDWWTRCTGNTKKFSFTNPLWVARYGTKAPGKLPGAWPKATFWQYTSSPIDQNRFSVGRDRLLVLAGQPR